MEADAAGALGGRVFGAYRLESALGAGGMGEVFLARNASGERVALKVLLPEASKNDGLVAMFMDEASIMAQIHHPNVLAVHDFGRVDGRYFLAMELLEGQSLAYLITEAHAKEGRLDRGVIATIGAHAARGLHAAHTARSKNGEPLEVVHRDVSPQNVFVTYRGSTKLIDFGVARAAERLAWTSKGIYKGKAAYMAPEQVARNAPDALSDVWALGVCLWEAITGGRLFLRDNQFHTMDAVMKAPIEAPSAVAGLPPDPLDEIVLRALERDPARRYPSAQGLDEALTGYAKATGRAEVAALMGRLFPDAPLPAPRPSEDRELGSFAGRTEDLDRPLRRSSAIHAAVGTLASELAPPGARAATEHKDASRIERPLFRERTTVILIAFFVALAATLAALALVDREAVEVRPLSAEP